MIIFSAKLTVDIGLEKSIVIIITKGAKRIIRSAPIMFISFFLFISIFLIIDNVPKTVTIQATNVASAEMKEGT